MTPPGALARGFSDASPPERAAFGILGAFALTIAAARTINLARERNRRAPALRSLLRRAYHAPGEQRVRVHHFVPGIGLAFASAVAAIAARADGRERWLGPAFGVGAGLTADELAILVEMDDPYWGQQRIPLLQAGSAGVAALGLAARFALTGRRG